MQLWRRITNDPDLDLQNDEVKRYVMCLRESDKSKGATGISRAQIQAIKRHSAAHLLANANTLAASEAFYSQKIVDNSNYWPVALGT
jgi:hypothetical protein